MKRGNNNVAIAILVFSFLITGLTNSGLLSSAIHLEGTANAQSQNETAGSPFVPGRILVQFRPETTKSRGRRLIAQAGAIDTGEIPGIGVHIVELPTGADEEAFVHAFKLQSEVDSAELDRIVAPADVIPNDPWYAGWQWHLPKISAPTAWSTTTGSSTIVIAVLDTGVDGSHADLMNKLVNGWNIYNNNSDTSDVNGHGTNVAGVVGAQSNNGTGVAGVCWAARIMPVRISDTTGSATYSTMASGLTWAADHGARVANISYMASDSSTVRSAAQYFQNHGGVVTSSAGNYSAFNSSPDNPYILTVSAMDINDLFSSFSNYGNNIDLVAPEGGYTTARGNSYMYAGGTSFSSPVVAGVAGLALSVNPSLTGAQVQDILKQSADDFGTSGWDVYFGWGRVNAARAVAAAGSGGGGDTLPPTVSFTYPSNGASVSGSINVQVAASDNVGVASVSLKVDGVLLGSDNTAPFAFTWNTPGVSDGVHSLTATALDAAGNVANASLSVTVNNAGDTTAPTVAISSPANGATVSGNVSVSINAADNVGVVKVELYVDGQLKATSTSAPYGTKWNARRETAGSHTLQSKAYDSAGNVGLSQFVTVYK